MEKPLPTIDDLFAIILYRRGCAVGHAGRAFFKDEAEMACEIWGKRPRFAENGDFTLDIVQLVEAWGLELESGLPCFLTDDPKPREKD